MLRKPHVAQAIRQAITDELGGDLAAKALQVPRQIIDNKGAFLAPARELPRMHGETSIPGQDVANDPPGAPRTNGQK